MGRTRTRTAAGLVLDAGALLALDRGDRRLIALLQRALAQGRTFRVPAGVVAQAWRDGRVQVNLARSLRCEEVQIIPLDEQLARSCGELCGAANSADIVDASVVMLARERQDPIVTSDPTDLRRLDRAAQIIAVQVSRGQRGTTRRQDLALLCVRFRLRSPITPDTRRRRRLCSLGGRCDRR